LTYMRLCWTFNLDFAHYLLAGILWAIGWSMIVLAALAWLPVRAVAVLGLAVIFLHNLAGPLAANLGQSWLWQILYSGGSIGRLKILYVLIPWMGVMAAGWGFGEVMLSSAEQRKRVCVFIGLSAIVLFVILRGTGIYGDPRAWGAAGPPSMPSILRFLNTTKYPASLQFLLMTLGPLILLVPFVGGGKILETFGRVPLFFYLLHIPIIHLLALLVSALRDGRVNPWLFENHPLMVPEAPPEYRWGLPLLYAVTVVALVLLYPVCRWYGNVKARTAHPLLRLI